MHHISFNELLRRINNLFCGCLDLLYLILFILTFWLGNLYQHRVLEILIIFAGIFFCRKFYKTSEENPKNLESF